MQRYQKPTQQYYMQTPIDPKWILVIILIVVAGGSLFLNAYQAVNPRFVTSTFSTSFTSTFPTTTSFTTTSTTTSTSTTSYTSTSISSITSTTTSNGQYYYTTTGTFNLNSPGCQYPMNPYECNQGILVVISGVYYASSTCPSIYGTIIQMNSLPYTQSQTPEQYGVYFYPSIPSNFPTSGSVTQAYGELYSNWPLGVPFPPSPLSTTICGGTQMYLAVIPPYT